MDHEMQRRRTFEIIAKWMGKNNDITIQFQPNCIPHADVKKKTIYLPNNLKVENLDKVLALVFHEAGHIAKSNFDVTKLVTTQQEKDILNACEDVRVDLHNIDYLPRIKDFYEELIKWEETEFGNNTSKIPIPIRALLSTMREETGFDKYADKDRKVREFAEDNDLYGKIQTINYHLNQLECGNTKYYPVTQQKIAELSKTVFGKGQKALTPEELAALAGAGKGGGGGIKSTKGTGKPNGKGVDSDGGGGQAGGQGWDSKYAKLFEPDPNAHNALDEVSLTEQTVQAFNELLKMKCNTVIHDGFQLDTNNLTSFFTGDLETLFKEVKIVKNKRSKILFLLDASGSMKADDGMCDDRERKDQLLVRVTKKIIRILDDVREIEGTNVEYDVRGFDGSYIKYEYNWEKEYEAEGGSTNILRAFLAAQEELLKDPTLINKMIILLTDGQVSDDQISKIRENILQTNSDVKCLILGIGLNSDFEKKCGGRNIISGDLADGEILRAIEDMLE